MERKKKIIIIVSCALLVVIAAVVFFCTKGNNAANGKNKNNTGNGKTGSETGTEVVTLNNEQDIETMSINVAQAQDLVKPGEGTLEIDKIQGFKSKKSNKKKKSQSQETTSEGESNSEQETTEEQEEAKYILSDGNLTIESIGSYTGNYVEDGSDEAIQNVAAIVVTNNSDQMLQLGDIEFQVNKKETATFRITNLLPKTSVLVMEANKRKYKKKDDYSYGKVTNAYLEAPSQMEDTFNIIKEDGKLTLENKTDNSYKKVYVYYKYIQLGGAYLGGITYRVPFENVEAKSKVSSVANHFSAYTSEIVDVKITEK